MQILVTFTALLVSLPAALSSDGRGSDGLQTTLDMVPLGRFKGAGKDCGDKSGSHVYQFNDSSCAQEPTQVVELESRQCLQLDPTTKSLGFEVNNDWAYAVWLYKDDTCSQDKRFMFIGRSTYYPCCTDVSTDFMKEYGPPRAIMYVG